MINPCERCLPEASNFILLAQAEILRHQVFLDQVALTSWDNAIEIKKITSNLPEETQVALRAHVEREQAGVEDHLAIKIAEVYQLSIGLTVGMQHIEVIDCRTGAPLCPRGQALADLYNDLSGDVPKPKIDG